MTDGKVSRQSVRNSILKIKVPEKEAKETGKEVRELHIFADEDHAHMQKRCRNLLNSEVMEKMRKERRDYLTVSE